MKYLFVICEFIIRNFYIHIPFCRQKCPYCKFALTPIFNQFKKKRYLSYLKKEIREFFQDQNYLNTYQKEEKGTLYFGGGTPSILTLDEVKEILECFPKEQTNEMSFECNPEDISLDYVFGLFDLGINRISLGVQSLNDTTLTAIHRSSQQSILSALDVIQSAKKKYSKDISFNIDFILGLPYSKKGEILNSIKFLHKKYPSITHTSIYMLEEGLYPKDWKSHSMNEGEMEEEYSEICKYFESIGWNHYEISNWAKSGFECHHNQGYWNHANYRGFGLSATNYIDGVRWENSASFSGYYAGKRTYEEALSEEQIKLENTIHRLRTFSLSSEGFDEKKLEKLKMDGYIEIRQKIIFLTPAGIFRENFILSELLLEESS